MTIDIKNLNKETKRTRKAVAKPVDNTPVLIIKHKGIEVARINPNSLSTFAVEHKLDINACESIINRTYVNHEGYTFEHNI